MREGTNSSALPPPSPTTSRSRASGRTREGSRPSQRTTEDLGRIPARVISASDSPFVVRRKAAPSSNNSTLLDRPTAENTISLLFGVLLSGDVRNSDHGVRAGSASSTTPTATAATASRVRLGRIESAVTAASPRFAVTPTLTVPAKPSQGSST